MLTLDKYTRDTSTPPMNTLLLKLIFGLFCSSSATKSLVMWRVAGILYLQLTKQHFATTSLITIRHHVFYADLSNLEQFRTRSLFFPPPPMAVVRATIGQ
jgi:hypothetical protein